MGEQKVGKKPLFAFPIDLLEKCTHFIERLPAGKMYSQTFAEQLNSTYGEGSHSTLLRLTPTNQDTCER